jgi:hypothetical protein
MKKQQVKKKKKSRRGRRLQWYAHARAGQSSFSKGLLKIIKNRNYDGLRARK